MNVTILASGSRGDVQPYVALGKGLAMAGHAVRLVTHENFRQLVSAHELEFWPVAGNVQDIAQSQEMRDRLEGGNFLAIMSQMAKEAQKGTLDLAEAGLAACQGADLILGGLGGVYVGVALAEKLGLPFLQAYLVPFSPTAVFPSVLLPAQPTWLKGAPSRLSHHVMRQIMWQAFRSADGMARARVLGLPRAPFFGPYRSDSLRQMPTLYGISPTVIAKPADWGENTHVTGYWFLDASEEWAPPGALLAFLEAGPTPVYVGFGSMGHRKPGETAELVLEALERAGQRAVVLSGWGGLKRDDLPASVFMLESVPHAWLFPRMGAVVHHGGAGTTAAGLRAGVPSVIVPFFGDQPFWGIRVARMGVGPAPIPRRRLTAGKLAAAIEIAVTDASMRRQAAELGAAIRAEDGIGLAVEVIASGASA